MARLASPGCSIWGPTLAENPLVTLARLLGGVVLMQGRLGHQVLGQMLVMDSHEIAVAGASVVIAASSEAKSAAAQVALRTAAPAIAAHMLITRDEQRLVRARELLEKRQRAVAAEGERLARTVVPPPPALPAPAPPSPAALPVPDPKLEQAEARIAALEEERNRLSAELAARSSPAAAAVDPVPEPVPESLVEPAPLQVTEPLPEPVSERAREPEPLPGAAPPRRAKMPRKAPRRDGKRGRRGPQ